MTPTVLIDAYHVFFNFIRRLSGGVKAKNIKWDKLELISLHIPKTAGTSFFHTLRQAYTPSNVIRIDMNQKGTAMNKTLIQNAYVYPQPMVIHGHFTIDELYGQLDLNTTVPIITWLRDPVARVISNYYYLEKELPSFSSQEITLLDYAQAERNRNKMSKFLKGIELDRFFFIGIVENYDQDIQVLSRKLNWTNLKVVQHNKTGSSNKSPVDEKTKALIRSYNQKDQVLYEEAMKFRKST